MATGNGKADHGDDKSSVIGREEGGILTNVVDVEDTAHGTFSSGPGVPSDNARFLGI